MFSRIILTLFILTSCSITLSAKKDPEKKKRGTLTVYYPNSKQIWYTGQNSNYRKEGTWTYYTPDGKVTHTDNYKAGLLNGERTVFLGSVLIAKENFSNGKPNGTQRYFYKSGNLKSMLFFTAGNPDSARFWSDGSAMYARVETYVNKEIVAVRTYNYFGQLKSREYFDHGKKTGIWKIYADRMNDTTTLSFITYKEGMKNGFCSETGYNEKLETWYVNDTLHGPYKYYANGKLKAEGTFIKGKLHGINKTYLFGQSIEEINYVDGKETGVSTIYSEIDGRVYSKRYFSLATDNRGAVLVDSAISFNPQGAKTREDIWLRQVNKANPEAEYHLYREWFENGKLKQTGSYSANWNQYIVTDYYENGKQKSVLIYANGLLNGKAVFWHDNGQKAMEFTAVNNEVSLMPKVWLMNGKPATNRQKEYIEIVNQFKPEDVRFPALEQEPEILETRAGDDYAKEEVYDVAEPPREPAPYIRNDVNPYYKAADCFPSGDSAIQAYIRQQLVYPIADAVFRNFGAVDVTIVLDENSKITKCNVSNDFSPLKSFMLREEAMRVVNSMPWKVPVKDGKPVSVAITVRVTFDNPQQKLGN
jgi:antitoxin component YwqK of YwqJK toxin-antitoxin module